MRIKKLERNINIMRKSRNQVFNRISVLHSPLPTPHSLSLRVTVRTRWLFLSLFLLFLSCKTTPKIPDAALMEKGVPLDSGASVYIFADVKKARSIIDLLPIEELNDSQTRQLMEKTEFLAAAFFPPESGRRFQLAAWGAYPSFRANLALSFNKNWKKQRSQRGDYWYSSSSKFSLALNSKQAFAASWLDSDTYDNPAAASEIEYPENFAEFRQGSPLSCWFDNPAPIIASVLNSSGIPINIPAEKLFINLFPSAEKKYDALIRIQFESSVQARGIASALSLAGRFISDSSPSSIVASLFLANPPVQNGRSLDIKTALLSEEEITQLFKLFFK